MTRGPNPEPLVPAVADHRRLVVDAMNVIGTRPDGWWRDPDAAKRRLIGQIQALAIGDSMPIAVVIDGRPLADLPEGEHGGVVVLYADRRGPDAADDRIVALAEREGPMLRVVTSDRALRDRLVLLGAKVEGASWLLRRLDQL